MKQFHAKIQNLHLIHSDGESACYGGYLDISFVNHTTPENLFDNNVRLQTFDNTKSPKTLAREKPVIGSILETLTAINDGTAHTSRLFIMNQGGAIMCESLQQTNQPDVYKITLTNSAHGIGNGQQTIRTAYYFKEQNNTLIKPGTLMFFKFLVNYSEIENNEICIANNKHNHVKNIDHLSNHWKDLADKLLKENYTLVYKNDKANNNKITGQKIDIYGTKMYSAIIAFTTMKIDQLKDEISNKEFTYEQIKQLDTDTIKSVHELTQIFEKWYAKNVTEQDYLTIKGKTNIAPKNELQKIFIATTKLIYNNENKTLDHKEITTNEQHINHLFDCAFEAIMHCINNSSQKYNGMTRTKSVETLFDTLYITMLKLLIKERATEPA